jgi:hypothetical protein
MAPTHDLLAPAQRRRSAAAMPRLHLVGITSVVAALQLLVAILVLGSHGIPGVLGGDFIAYYGAGKQALAGDWSHLYDLAAQLPYQQALLQHSGLPAGGPSMIPFDYPPPAALLFLPFALVPARVATVLWLVVNLGLVVASAQFMARQAPKGQFIGTTIRRSPTAALWLFILLPVDWGLLSGQPVGPILLLAELSFLALVGRRDGRAGIWLGLLAIFKPQLVLVPLLGLLVLGRPRAVVGAALSGLALFTISLALVGIHGLHAYVQLLRQIDPMLGSTAYSIRTEVMVNWRAWIVALPGISSQTALMLTTAAAIVTVGVALLLCARRHSPSQIALGYLALTAAGLVAGYHSHYQDVVVLLPPALEMLAAQRERTRSLLAAVLLLVAAPSLAWLLLGVFALAWLPVWTFLAVPGLVLLIAVAWPTKESAVPIGARR